MIKNDNLIFIKEAMKHQEVLDVVEMVAETIWHKIPDITSFEHTCYVNIGKEMAKKEVRSIRGLATHVANRSAAKHINATKYHTPTPFSDIESEINGEEDTDEMEFEPEDVLANVESDVIAKEMTALLAQDDHRFKMILGYWVDGNTNNAYISRSLARTFGGNAESHRRSISRFRESCRDTLAEAI